MYLVLVSVQLIQCKIATVHSLEGIIAAEVYPSLSYRLFFHFYRRNQGFWYPYSIEIFPLYWNNGRFLLALSYGAYTLSMEIMNVVTCLSFMKFVFSL